MFYRKIGLALSLLLLALPVMAGNHPPKDPPPTTPPTTENHNDQHQGQGQEQGQQQGQGQHQGQTATGTGIGTGVGIGQGGTSVATGGAGGNGGQGGEGGSVDRSGNSRNDNRNDNENHSNSIATGGEGGRSDSAATSGSSSGASANGTVSVGGDSNSYRALYIPAVIPEGVPAIASAGNLSVTTGSCGPLQAVERVPQQVLVKGMFGRTKLVDVGTTERLVPYLDAQGNWQTQLELTINGVKHIYGHRVTRYAAQNGTAMSSGISIGGGGNSGGWGQAGTNGSSSVQQVQRQYDLELCELDVVAPPLQYLPRQPRG